MKSFYSVITVLALAFIANEVQSMPTDVTKREVDCRSSSYYYDEGITNNACKVTNDGCDCDGRRSCYVPISFGSADYNN
eukprot:Awhi_evm1s14100